MRQFKEELLSWRNTPRADGLAPADLFYGRRLRTMLPSVREPPSSAEIAAGLAKRAQGFLKAREHFDSSARSLPALHPGQRVFMLNVSSKTWSAEATILTVRPDGLSYVLQPDDSSQTTVRNRCHLRPVPTAADQPM